MLYFILAPYSAIFVDPFKTVQVRNGYQLFWRKQKRMENHWNLFLDKKPLVPIIDIAFPRSVSPYCPESFDGLVKKKLPGKQFF